MEHEKYFDLNNKAFLAETLAMTADEVGAYIRLLCYQWIHGGIEDNKERISIITSYPYDKLGYALQKFVREKDGLLKNPWLEEQRLTQNETLIKQQNFSKKQSENVKKRWSRIAIAKMGLN